MTEQDDVIGLTIDKLHEWEAYTNKFKFPTWEEVPDIGLYIGQVVEKMDEYLDYLPEELKDEQAVTPATINNYVRIGIMPRPRQKRYYREHIAYLILICTLKQTLSISLINRIIPSDLSKEEIKRIYSAYVSLNREIGSSFVETVRKMARPMLTREEAQNPIESSSPEELVLSFAICAGYSKLLSEKIILLDYGQASDNPYFKKKPESKE